MPRRKDDPPDLVTIKVRIPDELKTECFIARTSGRWKYEAESTFIRYLLGIGLEKYKNVIQPAELSKDETPSTSLKTLKDYNITANSPQREKELGFMIRRLEGQVKQLEAGDVVKLREKCKNSGLSDEGTQNVIWQISEGTILPVEILIKAVRDKEKKAAGGSSGESKAI
jgi:hypothetical protein